MKAPSLPRERPLLYSGAMVRAILAGEKTQTRRVIKPPPGLHRAAEWNRLVDAHQARGYGVVVTPKPGACPHGDVGDRLWVRESCCLDWSDRVVYRADDPTGRAARAAGYDREPRWRPSIHMPRWASRITLEITGIRAERVQSISAPDIRAEGVAEHARSKGLDPAKLDLRAAWIDLWDSINGERCGGRHAWDRNPWTWVVEFRRLEGGGL